MTPDASTSAWATSLLEAQGETRRLGVVIVTYNSQQVIDACLSALRSAIDFAHSQASLVARVLVIDNNSDVRPLPSLGECICLDANVGFSSAANAGAALLADVDYLLFLNPDARLAEPALNELLSAISPECVVVGPRLIGSDGARRPSERPFHSVRREFRNQLAPVRRNAEPLARSGRSCLTGACMLVDAAFFREVGGFDESIRMYLEDVELCWQAWDRGRRVSLVQQALCYHDLGGSSSGANFNRTLKLHLTLLAARVEFVRRRSGRPAALAMRIAMLCGAIVRLVLMRGSQRRRQLAVAKWAICDGSAPRWELEGT